MNEKLGANKKPKLNDIPGSLEKFYYQSIKVLRGITTAILFFTKRNSEVINHPKSLDSRSENMESDAVLNDPGHPHYVRLIK